MRRAALLVALLALPTGVMAQDAGDGAPPEPAAPAEPSVLRIAVDLDSRVDGEAEEINSFQYYVWSTLHQFGLRVDSKREIGNDRYDRYVDGQTAKWQERAPQDPPASLVIEGSASCEYDNSEFFGQGQAHNYKGSLHVEVKEADTGEAIAVFDLEHSWGRLPTNYTRTQVLREYNDMMFTTLILGILSLDRIQEGVPEAKQAKLAKFLEKQRTRILEPLQENMADCDIAQFLGSLEEGSDE